MATTKETWTVTENGQERLIGYMPSYFPGVANSTEARRVTLGTGQQLPTHRFRDDPRPGGESVRHGGRLGRPAVRTRQPERRDSRPRLRLVRRRARRERRGRRHVHASPAFRQASTRSRRSVAKGIRSGPPEVAIAAIFVDGNDLENVALTGSSGGTVSGRVVIEGETPPKMSAVNVAVREPLRNQPNPNVLGLQRGRNAPSVKEDATFTIENVFGNARFQVTLPDGWMLKAVMHDGRDISDALIALGSGRR